MAIRQLSAFLENKPGSLVKVTEALSRASVDMRALSVADTQDFGILRLIVNDPDAARAALTESGILGAETPVVAVGVPDEPGALRNLVGLLSEKEINIEYLYAFLAPAKGRAFVALRVPDAEKAEAILRDAGFETVSEGAF